MTHHKGRLVLLIPAALLVAAAMAGAQPRVLAITGVSVVDVVEGRILPDNTITVTGNTITAVTRNGAPPRGAQIVDGRNQFIIPGLWDMHAHVEMARESSLLLNIANGVTGIRDMGSDLEVILKIREATASGRIVGPRIVAAGPILDDPPAEWPFRIRVKTPDDGRSTVQMLKRRGVDLIKVHNLTPRDVFFAIADEARRQELPLAGHVPLKVTIQEAVDAGMSTIEHMSEDGRVWKACSNGGQYRPEMCRPFFEMLARRRVWQTPTLVTISELGASIGGQGSVFTNEQLAYADTSLREFWTVNQRLIAERPEVLAIVKGQAATARIVSRDMVAAGVGLLAGCDALIAGFCVHEELAAMVSGGLTPLAALQTATINPARALGREKTLGSVATGKMADLVLLDANPLDSIGNVRQIRAVITAGRYLDRGELDRLLVQVKAAAQQ
jgi:imidazolonepropionase-like amidohydrolase